MTCGYSFRSKGCNQENTISGVYDTDFDCPNCKARAFLIGFGVMIELWELGEDLK